MDRKTQKPKIWMYRDKMSGRSKGECTVTFEDPFTAKSAIQWFDGKDFMGEWGVCALCRGINCIKA